MPLVLSVMLESHRQIVIPAKQNKPRFHSGGSSGLAHNFTAVPTFDSSNYQRARIVSRVSFSKWSFTGNTSVGRCSSWLLRPRTFEVCHYCTIIFTSRALPPPPLLLRLLRLT